MAVLESSYRPAPAMRLYMEQVDKRLRHDRERDEAMRLREREKRDRDDRRRVVEGARATNAVITELA